MSGKQQQSDYLTPNEVAQRLRVNGNKVRGWIAAGRLEAANIAQGERGKPRYRVTQAALDAFLKSRSNRPPCKPQRAEKREDSLLTLRDLLEQPSPHVSRHSLQA